MHPASDANIGELIAGLVTKADKIRALGEAGYTKSEIAKALGLRYQHVWNVLSQPRPDDKPAKASFTRIDAKIGPGGRIVIPSSFRDALGLNDSEYVILTLEETCVRLEHPRQGIRRAQEIAAPFLDGSKLLSDELIAERREEARRELDDG